MCHRVFCSGLRLVCVCTSKYNTKSNRIAVLSSLSSTLSSGEVLQFCSVLFPSGFVTRWFLYKQRWCRNLHSDNIDKCECRGSLPNSTTLLKIIQLCFSYSKQPGRIFCVIYIRVSGTLVYIYRLLFEDPPSQPLALARGARIC